MKKVTQLLLAGSLVFAGSTVAKAQPPEPPSKTAVVQQNNVWSPWMPEMTIDDFLSYFNGHHPSYPTALVEGAESGNPSLKLLAKNGAFNMGRFELRATNFQSISDPQNTDILTATFDLEFHDEATSYGVAQKDSVKMKKDHFPNGREVWKIIPNHFGTDNTDIAMKMMTGKWADGTSGYTGYLATMIAYPQEVLPRIYLHQCITQLRQLGSAMWQFVDKNNGRIDFDQKTFKEKLTPYLKSAAVFTAPDDPVETTSYDVNPNIQGLKPADFVYPSNRPSDIVAFYLGRNQKLDFRYGFFSPVCFTDGHVTLITREEEKDLRWKP